jgi:hypothetical protein
MGNAVRSVAARIREQVNDSPVELDLKVVCQWRFL